jgi:hypothetical protein
MNVFEWLLLAALSAGLCALAHQHQRLSESIRAQGIADATAQETLRQQVAQAGGAVARLSNRVATLEAPASFVGRWGTHEGKEDHSGKRLRHRVEVVHATMGADGAPASFRVRLCQDGRPPITYDIAANQVELEPRP